MSYNPATNIIECLENTSIERLVLVNNCNMFYEKQAHILLKICEMYFDGINKMFSFFSHF